MALFQMDQAQFNQIETHLNGLNGAVNKLAEGISPVDSSLHQAITDLSNNLAKWQAGQAEEIKNGLARIADVLANRQGPADQEEIDDLSNKLKGGTDDLQEALNEAPK